MPKIISVKFQAFIFLVISQRFSLTLLIKHASTKAVMTPTSVAISLTGSISILLSKKSRTGATRIIAKGTSNFFNEKGLE